MIIREEIEIAAPLPVVWAVFSALEEWDDCLPFGWTVGVDVDADRTVRL